MNMSDREYQSMEHYRLAYDWFQALRGDTTLKNIAKIAGVAERTVQDWNAGRSNPYTQPAHTFRPRQEMSDEDIRRAEELLDEEASYAEVGRTLGFSGHTIARHFPGRGWNQEQKNEFSSILNKNVKRESSWNKLTGPRLAKAKEILETGVGYEETRRRTGISKVTLRRYFPGYGLSQSESGKLAWSKVKEKNN
jgi:DNA invertase Pin-like site-specific DNA recombinase